jgi:hypothetical protein
MKNPISLIVFVAISCCAACTFHPPTLSHLVDQVRLSNEEFAQTRECEKEMDPAANMRCLQRAKSWRIPSHKDSTTNQRESADSPLVVPK